MKIGEIDRNLAVQSKLEISGLKYRSALEEPFEIYGLYRPKETGQYRRMPAEVAECVSEGVAGLSSHPLPDGLPLCGGEGKAYGPVLYVSYAPYRLPRAGFICL